MPDGNQKKVGSRRGGSVANGIFSLDKTKQRPTCQNDDTIMMSVKVSMQKMKFVCIHPQNDSLPVFTLKFDGLKMNYHSHVDHDLIDGQLTNFLIYDNTSYPNTMDPYV